MHERQLEKNLKIHQLEDEVDALRRKIEELQLNLEEKKKRMFSPRMTQLELISIIL